MEAIPYASVVESLMYAQICSRPYKLYSGNVGKILE